jgi:hypothetical protein
MAGIHLRQRPFIASRQQVEPRIERLSSGKECAPPPQASSAAASSR